MGWITIAFNPDDGLVRIPDARPPVPVRKRARAAEPAAPTAQELTF
jgi:hypothetical protein